MIKKKRVAAICRSQKELASHTTEGGEQWIGDSSAFYILAGIEPMSFDSLASMLDYTEKNIREISFTEPRVTDDLFAEHNSTDIQIETPPKRVIIKNEEYLIFETGTKLLFIDGAYLKPIVADDQTTYFMRTFRTSHGVHTALCVKKGFLPEAVILGVKFTEEALHDLFDELGGIINAVKDKYIYHLSEMREMIDEQLKLEGNDEV
ncbi:MAG: hypothetical protein HDT43_00855 [Ruminococcaceae bacterium]|nr:hypothetical protein [Oscillospiraceae bacterium]